MESSVEAFFALLSGAGGFLLVQFGSLIPGRRDFSRDVSLKIEGRLEELASRHCFLIKECLERTQSVGLESFDNLLRGDGRTGRDHFSDYAQTLASELRSHERLVAWKRFFVGSHTVLFCSLILLVMIGLIVLVTGPMGAWLIWLVSALVAIEVGSIAAIYLASSRVESY